jgi:hypothetical protein
MISRRKTVAVTRVKTFSSLMGGYYPLASKSTLQQEVATMVEAIQAFVQKQQV